MAPFQYQQYRNPFVGSIGELMQQPARAQAAAVVAKGNVWNGAAQQIAQGLQGVAGAVAAEADPRRQLENAQLADLKRNQAGRAALSQAIKQYTTVDQASGKVQADHQSIASAVAQAGFPEQGEAWLKMASSNAEALDKLQQSTVAHQRLQLETSGDLAFHAKSLDDFTASVGLAAAHGLVDEQTAQKIMQQADSAGPQGWEALKQKFVPFSPSYRKQQDELAKPIDVGPGHEVVVPGGAPGGQVVAKVADDPNKGDYTINGQRFSANGTPKGSVVPKENEPPKAGSSEDWVARARRLAVAKNGGQPLNDQQQLAVDSEALQSYKENNADPVLRDAAIAQKNMSLALAEMQKGLMPTREQAADVAGDLVNHRMAPEQLASLFSTRGKEGLAFKLAVQAEARKMEPNFNWEEASAEYMLSKSTGFQNTVRLMDSVQESMPRLLVNARRLGNGDWRSWSELANAAKGQFNDVDLKRLKTDALLVGDEVAKILAGGGTGSATSDSKLKQGVDLMNTSDSVPAIAGTLDEIQTLIGFRRRSMTRGTYMEGTAAVRPAEDQVSMIEAFDTDGKIHHAPAGTALPTGWKLKK